jgi:CheY-like chemotaxis protein
MKALVVDDQKICRLQLQGVLSTMGLCVDCAENGRDAVLLYIHAAKQGQPYRFVVMDNEMPVLDGCSAVMQIRTWERLHHHQADPSLICFVTGDKVCQSRYQYLNNSDSLTHFMSKPLDVGLLIELASSAVMTFCAQDQHQ